MGFYWNNLTRFDLGYSNLSSLQWDQIAAYSKERMPNLKKLILRISIDFIEEHNNIGTITDEQLNKLSK